MNEFLDHGRYCDWHHPRIDAVVSRYRDIADPRERAIALFRFVRDEIRYTFSPWSMSASATLAAGVGVCTNKSNLLIALMRAAGIPAAYGILEVDPQEYFGTIAPPFLKPLVSNRSIHVYAAASLDGRWVRCDASTDREMADKTSHFCSQTKLVDWDGRHDALDFLEPRHVLADRGLRANIDELLDKPPRHAHPETLARINGYLGFIREQPPFPDAASLIRAYTQRSEATGLPRP